MSERFDRYDLAARLEKFGDTLMTLCEKREAIENRIDVCNQISAWKPMKRSAGSKTTFLQTKHDLPQF